MLGAVIALPMVIVWVGYIAFSVIAITSGDSARLLSWLIATPIVLFLEIVSFRLLDRSMKFG